MDIIQIHFLTPYPASCLVRGQDGRPKSMQWGGVERGRVSSAAMKRAIRFSRAFAEEVGAHIGVRTARLGEKVAEVVAPEGGQTRARAFEAARVLFAGGKADRDAAKAAKGRGRKKNGEADAEEAEAPDDEAELTDGKSLPGARLGKIRDQATLQTDQLVYVSRQEIEAAAALVERIMGGDAPADADVKAVIGPTTTAVDIALFGRMFAERGDLRMTAAAEVAHPFTVDKAQVEADFYVAKDDLKPAQEDVGAGFMGEQGFYAGLFYGYASIDMGQLTRNLGGDTDLARAAARSFVRAALTVSPTGKKASFGSNANATWAMVERGTSAPRSLAGAFLRPVTGADHHDEAVQRAERLARAMSAAYDEDWTRASMDLFAGRGSLRELLAVVEGEGT